MFKKKDKQITVFNNKKIFFVTYDNNENLSVIDSHPIDKFLSDNFKIEDINEDARSKVNSLLIVPDYWFGNNTYVFQSKKKSLVEPFIQRKLTSEYPDLPDIKDFFEYNFYETDLKENGLYVYFLHEPEAILLHNRLAEFSLNPHRITTPALLWEQKLKKNMPDSQEGGKALVHLLSSECFLYFFLRGNFLFSRTINLSHSERGTSEKFIPLAYEISQSEYLFSQKAKANVEQFFLLSSGEKDSQELSKLLGKDIKDLSDKIVIPQTAVDIYESLGTVSPFNSDDLLPSAKYLSISYGPLKQEMAWKQVQHAGIIIGLILLLLLSVESFFVWESYRESIEWKTKSGIMTQVDPKQIIQEYNDALDLFISDTERVSIRETLLNIANSLPENILLEKIGLDVDTNPGVEIKGIVMASGPKEFRNLLSLFLSNLGKHIQGSRSLTIHDIDFEFDEKSAGEQGYNVYLMKFRFDLP